jgi:hypothetical protein
MPSLAASSGALSELGPWDRPAALLAHLDAGGVPDALHRDWENVRLAIGGAMTFACEDGGDFHVRHAIASQVEHSVTHFRPSSEFGD